MLYLAGGGVGADVTNKQPTSCKEYSRTDGHRRPEIQVYNEPTTPIQHKAPAHTTGQPATTDQATTISQSVAHQSTTDPERNPERSDVSPQNKIFKCGKCDKSFTRNANMTRHFKICGRREYIKYIKTSKLLHGADVGPRDKIFKCDKCDKSFARNPNMKRHMTICGQQFKGEQFFLHSIE